MRLLAVTIWFTAAFGRTATTKFQKREIPPGCEQQVELDNGEWETHTMCSFTGTLSPGQPLPDGCGRNIMYDDGDWITRTLCDISVIQVPTSTQPPEQPSLSSSEPPEQPSPPSSEPPEQPSPSSSESPEQPTPNPTNDPACHSDILLNLEGQWVSRIVCPYTTITIGKTATITTSNDPSEPTTMRAGCERQIGLDDGEWVTSTRCTFTGTLAPDESLPDGCGTDLLRNDGQWFTRTMCDYTVIQGPTELSSSEPEPSQPPSSEPEPSQPPSSEPEPSQPPSSSEPEPSQPPSSSEPEPSQPPSSSEPEPSQPPSSSEPEPSQPPSSSEPEPSQPPSSEPEPSQPPSSEPEPSQPPSSEPEPSQPPSSELEPSQPPSSEPEPSQPPSSMVEPSEPPSSVVGHSESPSSEVLPSEPPYSGFEPSGSASMTGSSELPSLYEPSELPSITVTEPSRDPFHDPNCEKDFLVDLEGRWVSRILCPYTTVTLGAGGRYTDFPLEPTSTSPIPTGCEWQIGLRDGEWVTSTKCTFTGILGPDGFLPDGCETDLLRNDGQWSTRTMCDFTVIQGPTDPSTSTPEPSEPSSLTESSTLLSSMLEPVESSSSMSRSSSPLLSGPSHSALPYSHPNNMNNSSHATESSNYHSLTNNQHESTLTPSTLSLLSTKQNPVDKSATPYAVKTLILTTNICNSGVMIDASGASQKINVCVDTTVTQFQPLFSTRAETVENGEEDNAEGRSVEVTTLSNVANTIVKTFSFQQCTSGSGKSCRHGRNPQQTDTASYSPEEASTSIVEVTREHTVEITATKYTISTVSLYEKTEGSQSTQSTDTPYQGNAVLQSPLAAMGTGLLGFFFFISFT